VQGWLEARRLNGVPWSKTGAWAAAAQRHVERSELIEHTPMLVIQTQSAFLPDSPYVVYTDRVAREGAAANDVYRRPGSPGWLDREEKMLRGARAILVMGPSTARALVSQYGVGRDRIEVVGAAPNASVAIPRPRTGAHRLLFIGTAWDLKGGPVLMEAFQSLRRHRPDLTLTIVGCRPTGPLPAGVCVRGRLAREAMRAVLDNADVFVLPTRSEAFGIAFIEALQSGLPCVGTQTANVPWIIGEAGICVPPDDPDAVSNAVQEILNDYERWACLARARGVALAAAWTWTRISQRVTAHLGLSRPRN
jgi:glycosyltransferase involved in cell wall biosynthesis